VKLSLKAIWESQQSLPKLAGKEFPVKTSYWIGKNVNKLQAELKQINETRVTLIKKYGTEEEKTKQWNVKPEHHEVFMKEFDAFMETEVEVDIKMFKLSDLGEAKFTAQEMACIDFMFEADEPKPECPEKK
jgi:hypothetical protein